jgi:hypothetical protein
MAAELETMIKQCEGTVHRSDDRCTLEVVLSTNDGSCCLPVRHRRVEGSYNTIRGQTRPFGESPVIWNHAK